jgi:hypothetical protein
MSLYLLVLIVRDLVSAVQGRDRPSGGA